MLVGQPLGSYFDCFYGVSTGAIISSLLATNRSVDEIKSIYLSSIPSIMKPFRASSRTKNLKDFARELFGEKDFNSFEKLTGIVASSMKSNAPKIFKSCKSLSHSGEASFSKGFGKTIAEAVVASCAAKPFFSPVTLEIDGRPETFLDGGFSANNPTLYAVIDARYALQRHKDDFRVLNVGTGDFASRICVRSCVAAVRLCFQHDFVQRQFAMSSNSHHQIATKLLQDHTLLRLNGPHTEISTNLLEARKDLLLDLFEEGRKHFRTREQEVLKLLGLAHQVAVGEVSV